MKVDATKFKIPNHIGFIMDGNGRWGKRRMLPRMAGHKAGVEALKRVAQAAQKIGIKIISVFAFSTENWNRPKEEVDGIINLVENLVTSELDHFVESDIKIMHMGTFDGVPSNVVDAIKYAVEKTKNCKDFIINIAFNYGGRQEILNATNNLIKKGVKCATEENFKAELFCDLDYPDIIVRTSGEERVSNFMLWQLAYSEFIFIETLWPDMNEKELIKIIQIYTKRNRRFGKIDVSGEE